MFRFGHFSDWHFHKDQRKNIEANRTANIVNERYPNHIQIHTGDIVDDGLEKQYLNARKVLGGYVCPGNHGYGVGGNWYSRASAKLFDFFFGTNYYGLNRPKVDLLEDGDTKIALIGLDSCRETWWPGDFARGRIGWYQRLRLDWYLDKYIDYVRIVYLHHHPFYRHPFLALSDSKKLMRVLRERCEVLCFGHKHVSEMWENRDGIKFILASDDSPGKPHAREITVQGKRITVSKIKITE